MNKWLVLGGVALLLAWGPFLYAELTSEPVEKKTRDLPSERARDDEPVELIDLEEEEEPAEEQPAQAPAEEEVAAAEAELAEHELEAVADHDDDAPAVPSELEHLAGAEEGDEAPPPAPPPHSGPTAVLKQSYESEPRDALWASAAEQRIAAMFSGDDIPEDMFQRASCRQAVCQLELDWSPEHVEAYASLQQTIGEQFGAQIGVEPSGEVGEDGVQSLLLYVLREGYSLQDLQN